MYDKPARYSQLNLTNLPARRWPVMMGAAFLLAGLAGCAGTGDLGRKPESVVDDKLIPIVSKIATHVREQPVSWYRFTESEQRLRQEADQLATPAGRPIFLERTIRRVERAKLVSNLIDWNSPERYNTRLQRQKFPNGRNRVRRVMTHMLDDSHFMLRFERAMAEVLRADRSRAAHLRRNHDYPISERRNAETRIIENQGVMRDTIKVMNRRIDAYDEALHRTPLRFPGTNMKPPRRLLLDLQDYTKRLAARLAESRIAESRAPAIL